MLTAHASPPQAKRQPENGPGSIRERLSGANLSELSYSRITRCCSLPPKSEDRVEDLHILPYNVMSKRSPSEAGLDVKKTYFSSDGIPRTVELTRNESRTGWEMHHTSISLRGDGRRMWLRGGKDGITGMGWGALPQDETGRLIADERADLKRIFFQKGGYATQTRECNFDFTDQIRMLIESLDSPSDIAAARARRGNGAPMLVPPEYPFSVPLEITSGCSERKACGMCALAGRSGRLGDQDSIKRSIREWATGIGQLVASTQSVFLGRNSLPKPELLRSALEFLRSDEVTGAITRGLPGQLKDFIIRRKDAWGSIARLSSFATAREVNAYSVEELAALRRMGLGKMFLSLETGSDRLRRETLGKGYGCAELEAALEKVCGAGISPRVIFMLGVGGKEGRDEHVRETARALARLQAIADSHSSMLMFLASPLDSGCMPSAVRERIGAPGLDEMAAELNAIGRIRLEQNDLNAYLENGAGMALDGGKEVRIQIYHYQMLFV